MDDDRLKAAIALHDRFTHDGMDRRAFMAGMRRIAGGAAAATALLGSIAANAQAAPQVAESDPRLTTQDSELEVRPGRRMRVYMASPRTGGGQQTIIVIHENRGLNAHIRDVARRFALAGYRACAPDFLSPTGGTPADEDAARTMIGQLDLADSVSDGVALIRMLGEGRQSVGIVGFCWGGAMVHRLAVAAGADLDAGVSFYGPAPDPSEAARVQAPLLVLLAGRDERVNASAGPWVEALQAAGKEVRSITYPDVDHAFHNDTSAARYDPAAAEQAWAETIGFFGRHLR